MVRAHDIVAIMFVGSYVELLRFECRYPRSTSLSIFLRVRYSEKTLSFRPRRIIRTADRLAEYHFRCVQRWRILQLSTPELNCMLVYDVILSILSVRICVSLVPHTHVLEMANRQLGR